MQNNNITSSGASTPLFPSLTPGMPLTGTGAATASGGASSDGGEEYIIERPLSLFGDTVSTYRKVHKFMTFGLAPNIISGEGASATDRFLTTYLAEIPWHIPIFYLNPCEFALLPVGSRCIEMSISVTYRGSTIQFETAASTSGLATLNQINDIAVASALNKTGWGSNVSYTEFNSTQPMIPTKVAKPKYRELTGSYRGMDADYYGGDNYYPNFSSYYPHHQLGRQTFLYNYWVMSTRTAQNTSPTPATNMYGGWPCLANKIEQMDGKTVVNTPVLQMSYEPKMGWLKPPILENPFGLPYPGMGGTMGIPVMGNGIEARRATIIRDAPTSGAFEQQGGAEYAVAQTFQDLSTNLPSGGNAFDIYTVIEKSQISQSGPWGRQDPHIQPSAHIGVQPVPALTTASLIAADGVFNNWTDTRAYWEVTAEMKVKSNVPTQFPQGSSPNVPSGDVIRVLPLLQQPAINRAPHNDGATFAGLYADAVPNLPFANE